MQSYVDVIGKIGTRRTSWQNMFKVIFMEVYEDTQQITFNMQFQMKKKPFYVVNCFETNQVNTSVVCAQHVLRNMIYYSRSC